MILDAESQFQLKQGDDLRKMTFVASAVTVVDYDWLRFNLSHAGVAGSKRTISLLPALASATTLHWLQVQPSQSLQLGLASGRLSTDFVVAPNGVFMAALTKLPATPNLYVSNLSATTSIVDVFCGARTSV